MRDQKFWATTAQYRFAIGLSLAAVFLFVSITIGLLAPHGDSISLYRNVLASVAILAGCLGLLIFAARQLGWELPSFLMVPEGMRDQNWRLLVMSLIAIALPLIVIMTQSLLFH